MQRGHARGSSHGRACQWLPPSLFDNFHRALTFTLHSTGTHIAHACLPAYIRNVMLNIISQPDPTHSHSPTAVLLPASAAVSVLHQKTMSWMRHCFFWLGLQDVLSHAVCWVCFRYDLADNGPTSLPLVAGR